MTDSDARPKILCVDDDPSVLSALLRLLNQEFEVLTASDGDSALQALDRHPEIAIVLSDQCMNGMSGLELLSQVQTKSPDCVRAILSAHLDIKEMAEAINKNLVHRILLKPWDNAYLRLQMLESLSTHSTLKEKHLYAQLAVTDPITRVKNHRYFQDQLRIEVERALRHDRSLSLLMLDIDHFKRYNDQFGHPMGDLLLKEVAQRIEEQVRAIDTVARYGGEEFVIILPDTSLDQARLVADRIRTSFDRKPFSNRNGDISFVTLSLGLAALPTHASTAPELIAKADQALYQAKRQGRNQTVGS